MGKLKKYLSTFKWVPELLLLITIFLNSPWGQKLITQVIPPPAPEPEPSTTPITQSRTYVVENPDGTRDYYVTISMPLKVSVTVSGEVKYLRYIKMVNEIREIVDYLFLGSFLIVVGKWLAVMGVKQYRKLKKATWFGDTTSTSMGLPSL